MKKLLGIVVLGLLFSLNSYAIDITIKKTKNQHLTAKPSKEHFMVNKDVVRDGEQSQKFILPHGSCNKQDCKWSAQRTERELKLSHKSKKNQEIVSTMLGVFFFLKTLR